MVKNKNKTPHSGSKKVSKKTALSCWLEEMIKPPSVNSFLWPSTCGCPKSDKTRLKMTHILKILFFDCYPERFKNPSIYNKIRWVAWTMGQMNRRKSVWCSKYYFFSWFLAKFFKTLLNGFFFSLNYKYEKGEKKGLDAATNLRLK